MKVLVIGGGIGGLSTTLALRREGFDVDVVERDPEWGGVRGRDHPARQRAAGARLARDWPRRAWRPGTRSAAIARGSPTARRRSPRTTGRRSSTGLPPGNGLTRPKLHEILTSRTLESGAEVRTGVTFTEIEPTDDHVDVTFTDGERRHYDLVVGRRRPVLEGSRAAVRPRARAALHRSGVLALQPAPDRRARGDLDVLRPRRQRRLRARSGEDLMYILTIETPMPGPEGGDRARGRRRRLPRGAWHAFAGPVARRARADRRRRRDRPAPDREHHRAARRGIAGGSC